MKKFKKLSNIEWDTCWMAIRYAMNRYSIASTILPCDIITHYYNRFTEQQMESIVIDLQRELQYLKPEYQANNFSSHNYLVWIKFMVALDKTKHNKAILIDDSEVTIFRVDNRYYSLESYLDKPHIEKFIPDENIKQILI